jgi:hypothetical protein
MKPVDAIKRLILGVENSDSTTSTSEITATLNNWSPSDQTDANVFLDLSKRSLDEVTRLTGYEDEKANRILTAMAFLSALAGLMFASFVDKYHGESWTSSYLIASVYVIFFLYIFILGLGAIFVVFAVKPRFNVPADWGRETGKPGSFLFFKQIIRLKPDVWAQAFTSRSAIELQAEYVRNSILETYLIAVKVRDKLAYLEPGMGLLWRSTQVLLLWIVIYGITIIFSPISQNSESVGSTLMTLKSQLINTENRIQKIDNLLMGDSATNKEGTRRLEQILLGLDATVKKLANQVESLKLQSTAARTIKKRER